MEPVVRDTLLLFFCWILSIILFFVWFLRKVLYFIRRIAPPALKRIPFLKKISRLEFRPPHFGFTFRKFRLSDRAFVVIYTVLLALVTFFYVKYYFLSKPEIVWQSQQNGTLLADETQAVTVVFDKPINKKELEVLTLPEDIEAVVSYQSPLSPLLDSLFSLTGIRIIPPIYTKLVILPKHSIPYETGIVFYLRNLTDLGGKSGRHEHALNFETPNFPEIKTTYPKNNENDVQIDAPIKIEFSTEVTESLNVKVESSPEVVATFSETAPKVGQLVFSEPLKQGTTYTMTLIREKQKLDVQSEEVIATEEIDEDFTFTFKTVTPAGTKSITPTGTSAHPASDIVLTFTEPMNDQTVLDNLIIEPQIEFDSSWDEKRQVLTLNPRKNLEKATSYTLTLKTGMKTMKNGALPQEITHTFETFGNVKIVSFAPRSGSTGNSVSSVITLTFDQKVDQSSAQSKIVVSPGFAATYIWNGNTVSIKPKAPLAFSTKYTVKISPGIKSIEGLDSKDTFTYSFSTRAQIVKIYVPLYSQPGYFDCNLTATSMALAAKGVSASVDQIRSYVGAVYDSNPPSSGNPNSDWINYYGVHWDPLASYIRYRGRGADVKSGWSLAGIASEIQKGNPVIIFWYNGVTATTPPNSWYSSVGARPGMHSVVVYGFAGSESNPTYLYVQDPWYAYRKSYYTSSQFLNKWNYMGRRAIVVK